MNETNKRRIAAGCMGAVLAGGLLLTGGEASATITLGPPTILAPDGGALSNPNRPAADEYWISYEDCKNNVAISWVVTISPTTEAVTVQASAQGTCPQPEGDTITSLEGCWTPPNGGNIASGQTFTIYAQDLVQGALGISNCDPTTAADGGIGDTIVWPQPVTIFFFDSSTTGGTATDSYSWTQTEIALQGPTPPTSLTLGVGDRELIASLPSTQSGDIYGYYFYCYPLNGSIGAGGSTSTTTTGSTSTSSTTSSTTTTTSSMSDGGTDGSVDDAGSDDAGTSDAGAGGASTGTGGTSTGTGGASTGAGASTGTGGTGGSEVSNCPAGTTIPGLDVNNPDPNSPYICGSQVPFATTTYNLQSVNHQSLQDGVPYAVGVAAYDPVGNIGPLSTLQCATPQPVDSFFPTYCLDGGPGCVNGCGSCNVGSNSDPLWPALSTLALGCVAVMARRSRRRGRQLRERG